LYACVPFGYETVWAGLIGTESGPPLAVGETRQEPDMRRVVITGLGMLSPLACGVEETWQRLLAGQSGAGKIQHFDASHLPCQIACEVPLGDGSNGTFDADQWMAPKDQRKVDRFITYAICAAEQAISDAGWKPEDEESRERTGVMIGSGIGGLESIANTAVTLKERGPRRISPFFIPGALVNLCSGQVSIKYGFRGPNHAVVTACSTGAHAIGDAARMIMLDDTDVMIAGGAESPICEIGVAGFAACKALSTHFNETPELASRPYDKGRDGFVMGEGAGVVVLEEYEHAIKRGARIYGEVLGYGMSGDAYHITSPAPDGDGGFRSMKAALRSAGLDTGDIDYINAHGTSTPLGDEIELGAVTRLLGEHAGGVTMSSTKSSTGHLLGAAGAIEAIFSVLAIRDNVAPPTLNLEDPSVETDIDLAPHKKVERKIDRVLSNSFGFGGTNASVIFGRVN
jgi:3-oxoacyl-[acyl-carrier-protein] synthase II